MRVVSTKFAGGLLIASIALSTSLPADEIAGMTTAEGQVTADCQFCSAHYEFDPEALGVEAAQSPDGAETE